MIKIVLILSFLLGFHFCIRIDNPSQSIQRDVFRILQASMYRGWASKYYCYSSPISPSSIPNGENISDYGRHYSWSEVKGYVINLIRLYIYLQIDPACEDKQLELINIVSSQENLPEKDSDWWRDVWYPSSLDAFTCNYKEEPYSDLLPDDIVNMYNNSLIIRKSWYLILDYLGDCVKERENIERREDYDVSLYIPFIDKIVDTQYMKNSNMRVGFPTYIGPSIWRTFHTFSHRIVEYSCIEEKAIELMKIMFLYFAVGGQPCPYCREHFISHVSKMDIERSDEETETFLNYPLSYVLFGNLYDSSNLYTRLSQANSGKQLERYFWSLHNAVTSSVTHGVKCRTEELYDKYPFLCKDNTNTTNMIEFYPVAKRYEYTISRSAWKEIRKTSTEYLEIIGNKDSVIQRNCLYQHWKSNSDGQCFTPNFVDQFITPIKFNADKYAEIVLTSQFINRYRLETVLNCSRESDIKNIIDLYNTYNINITKIESYSIPDRPKFCSLHQISSNTFTLSINILIVIIILFLIF